MRVLVTGPAGHIGAAVSAELIQSGHDVIALARSDRAAAVAADLGAGVRRGDVRDLEGLRPAVGDVDAVVHLAFDNAAAAAGDLAGASAADLAVVEAFGDALEGTGKAFLGIGVGPTGDEAVDAVVRQNPRSVVPRAISGFDARGVRSLLLSIPPVVHSRHDRIGFIPTLIGLARSTGVSGYLGEGATRWPAVHTLDLARLVRLAIEKGPAGTQLYGAAEDDVSTRQVAETIAEHLDVTAASIPADRADEHFGGFADIMRLDFPPMTSAETRTLLGWTPTQPGLLADLDEGHYFASPAEHG